ncbi:F-box domain, Leucine-rich repeat domain, L domain-like protein [Artemisia annua]|uniref:F-box domain, Leucine-rich repeat domain, L domain-like protein n=1 Tax=Artemisia annua TaxID=35608 RepID=A0A2U1QIS6_ARTAN|nr:F-box domain, Leucine-rich repeat domain, L domain-like protein [Artemisia annua]
MRMNVEGDRLSNLPDDLIHKILSFNGLKNAIKTSVLSSRWRYIWTSMPFLDFSFSTEDSLTLSKFCHYVSNVLSSRNQLKVFSWKLCFSGDISQNFVNNVMNYASSHNIQHLNIVCSLERDIDFPISLFSSSLKHLTLKRHITISGGKFISSGLRASSNLKLPALTTLHLFGVTLCRDETIDKSVGLFPKCPNLKNLTLEYCLLTGLDVLSICHPLLLELTLDSVCGSANSVNVVTPQLKNLTIRKNFRDNFPYVISAPDLASLLYTGHHPLHLFTDSFHSLEKVDLRVYSRDVKDAPRMFHLLQQLHNVKFLTLNLEIVEVQLLSSSVGLISRQPSPFTSLRSLKIYPKFIDEAEHLKEKLNISEVKSYLLDSSPNATFTMVTREEIIAKRNTELEHKCLENLWSQLKWAITELRMKITNMAQIDRGKTKMESDKENILEQHIAKLEHLTQIEKTMTHTDTCLKDLNRQIKRGKTTISNIISCLHNIIKILAKLPMSNRAELQLCFSSLCSIVMNKIMDRVKSLCDNERRPF